MKGLRFHRTTGDAFKDARYASAVERPVPRGLLVSRPFWFLGVGCLFIWWLVVRAAVAFWRWC